MRLKIRQFLDAPALDPWRRHTKADFVARFFDLPKFRPWATNLDQAQIEFENEGGETYICGNPPYTASGMAIEDKNGKLMITQYPEVHTLIKEFLSAKRGQPAPPERRGKRNFRKNWRHR